MMQRAPSSPIHDNYRDVKQPNTPDHRTDYVNEFVYQDGLLVPIAIGIGHPDGRCVVDGSGFRYEYHYKDHLGNLRLAFTDLDGDGVAKATEVLQEAAYYPYGMKHEGLGTPVVGPEHRFFPDGYRDQGKEMEQDFGVDWADFGARRYDGQLGRWWGVDAMAHDRAWASPYNFVQDNPVGRVDLNGQLDDWFSDGAGNIIWNDSREKEIVSEGKTWSNFGNSLTINASSFISNVNNVGAPGVAGEKLTQYFNIVGNYKTDGSFSGFTTSIGQFIGNAFGLDILQGNSGVSGTSSYAQAGPVCRTDGFTMLANAEYHTEVNWKEAPMLKLFAGDIVDVAQHLYISLDNSNHLQVDLWHGSFPSVEVNVLQTGDRYQYNEQSFWNAIGYTEDPARIQKSASYQKYADEKNAAFKLNNAPFFHFKGFISGKDPSTY
jgi:RHS repeat-associated protein